MIVDRQSRTIDDLPLPPRDAQFKLQLDQPEELRAQADEAG
jgi:hypothetical protein